MSANNRAGAWRPARVGDSDFKFQAGLSVFFPAYNDAASLPFLLDRTFETLRRIATDYEVIVVNDGSVDGTAELLEHLCEKYAPLLRVVTHEQNRGYGAALRSGFSAATKEFIFYTDGDGQYDPAELEDLLRAVTPETGLVNGYKLERSDPWHRIAIGWLYNRFARWLFRIGARDVDCDFRVIRRSALDRASLRSTGGTICIELMRSLELSRTRIVEIPVHHYPRAYGRSQFFRVRSLAVTFLQLCRIFLTLVLMPALTGAEEPKKSADGPNLSRRRAVAVALGVVLLAALAYAPALRLPFIGDDYLQIQLAREYGPASHWWTLVQDASYRTRATSLALTYWLDRAFGLAPFYYNAASLLLHILDSLLVLALGFWRPIGWRVAAFAALFFAVSQRHSEAVLWFAAIPELLAFFFVVAAFLLWIAWLEERPLPNLLYAGALCCYVLALLSKEAAVAAVPLFAVAVWCHPRRPWKKLWGLAPFGALAVIYLFSWLAARGTHPRLYEAALSLNTTFAATLVRGLIGLFGVWGVVSLPMLFTAPGRRRSNLMLFTSAWMVLTLLPYSFLLRVPAGAGRQTYLASVGLAFVVATALVVLCDYARRWNKTWLVPVAAVVILAHQFGYQWTVKYPQYFQRALPTEELVHVAASSGREIHAKCFPYSPLIANLALELRLGTTSHPSVRIGAAAARQPDAVDFCNGVSGNAAPGS